MRTITRHQIRMQGFPPPYIKYIGFVTLLSPLAYFNHKNILSSGLAITSCEEFDILRLKTNVLQAFIPCLLLDTWCWALSVPQVSGNERAALSWLHLYAVHHKAITSCLGITRFSYGGIQCVGVWWGSLVRSTLALDIRTMRGTWWNQGV